MRTPSASLLRPGLFFLIALTLAFALAGCGDSNEESSTTSDKPALTVPDEPISSSTGDDAGASDSTGDTGADTGGTSVDNTGGSSPQAQDTPQNDTAAPKDSPANSYEQFCQDNPGACNN